MKNIYIHNEFWNHMTGAEVLHLAYAAIHSFADDVHVYTPQVLTVKGSDAGEANLWWSVRVPSHVTPSDVAYAIREVGIRVKMAGYTTDTLAKGTLHELTEDLYSDV